MLTLSAARLRHRLQNDHFKGEWNLMTLFGKNKFAVVFCSQEIFRGAVFAKRNSKWTVIRWGEVSSGSEFPGDRLKALLKEIGYDGDFTYEVHGFYSKIPDDLRIEAGKLGYKVGMYLMEMYDKA